MFVHRAGLLILFPLHNNVNMAKKFISNAPVCINLKLYGVLAAEKQGTNGIIIMWAKLLMPWKTNFTPKLVYSKQMYSLYASRGDF